MEQLLENKLNSNIKSWEMLLIIMETKFFPKPMLMFKLNLLPALKSSKPKRVDWWKLLALLLESMSKSNIKTLEMQQFKLKMKFKPILLNHLSKLKLWLKSIILLPEIKPKSNIKTLEMLLSKPETKSLPKLTKMFQ